MIARFWARGAAVAALVFTATLPLLGGLLAGHNWREALQFPPRLPLSTEYPHFSWLAVALVLAPLAMLTATWLKHRSALAATPVAHAAARKYPGWGWLALAWTLGWWVLAWTRFSWFSAAQRYTFLPLWIGFIVSVNALVFARTGTCLMLRAPRRWGRLFAASAMFWWMFEWLNRFSNNWHYLGVADLGAAAYALNATLCFSTVLPAVAAATEWLGTYPRFAAGCAAGPPLRWFLHPLTAVVLIVGGLAGLFGAGALPERFYPALWAAPLALFLAIDVLRGRGLACDVARGDWRRVAAWAAGALVCGLFWELWNIRSAAHWLYTVPYVERWPVFAMPVLGYVGYLPFGLECYFVATWVLGEDPPLSSASST